MFERELRVTIQQIGAMFFLAGQEERPRGVRADEPGRRRGLDPRRSAPGLLAWGIAERVDDYCATAFVYCREPQPVPRLDLDAALADIGRRDYEVAAPQEGLQGVIDPTGT